ncbi:hypothetical protein DL769_005171 [Monosporascus sp. CRB-8-3]|nr:hypothetical protein DL769_005171 [Monosporascus sp. CRB-8-3]
MENKRKASGSNGHDAGSDDRAAKRRKLQEEFGDLSKGETPESTTAYGLSILESIRATTDKNGRPVSPFFETLPSRSEDPEYYKKIRLPLSLQIIERKLKNAAYPNLSTLESDFKRLVSNAKETNGRQSEVFSDAERVRKAVSNLMVKHNPAYKAGNYQAVATPLPPSPGPDAVEEEDAEGEEDVGGEPSSETTAKAEKEREEQEEQDEKEEKDELEEKEEKDLREEEDAEGEDDQEAEAEEEEQEEEGEEEEEDEEEEEADDDNDEDPEPRPVVRRRRRGPGRPPKNSASSQKSAGSGHSGKADTHYENTGYKGLTFQQAQEKIVEDVLRKKDESGEYPYFEPFVYLPPRTLKDYYEIIAEPLSLKALQKQVRGQHGRGAATYISDFKSWAAFEDQASLIWKNAYHYNEDGSEIFVMAQELEELFTKLIKEAKQHVPEPPQPKIKLKVSQSSEPPTHPKKITIHVGGKASVTGSPAPPTAQSGDGEATRNGTPAAKNPFGGTPSGPLNLGQLDKARSVSASAPSPSPSAGLVKPEEAARASPATAPPNTMTFQQFAPPVMPPGPGTNGVVSQPPPPPPPPKQTAADILEAQKYRPFPIRESEAIMPRLQINTHPSLQVDNRLSFTLPASTIEAQQEITLHVPSTHYRVQIRPIVASFLEAQQRPFDNKRAEPVFETTLRFGVNRMEISLVAALPKGEKAPNGLSMELESCTAMESPAVPFPFFDLPPELRETILSHLLVSPTGIHINGNYNKNHPHNHNHYHYRHHRRNWNHHHHHQQGPLDSDSEPDGDSHDDDLTTPPRPPPRWPLPYFLAGTQMYREASGVFYARNEFVLDVPARHLSESPLFHRAGFLGPSAGRRRVRRLTLVLRRPGGEFADLLAPVLSDMVLCGSLRHLSVHVRVARQGHTGSTAPTPRTSADNRELMRSPPYRALFALLSDPDLETVELWASRRHFYFWCPFHHYCGESRGGEAWGKGALCLARGPSVGNLKEGTDVPWVRLDWRAMVDAFGSGQKVVRVGERSC